MSFVIICFTYFLTANNRNTSFLWSTTSVVRAHLIVWMVKTESAATFRTRNFSILRLGFIDIGGLHSNPDDFLLILTVSAGFEFGLYRDGICIKLSQRMGRIDRPWLAVPQSHNAGRTRST